MNMLTTNEAINFTRTKLAEYGIDDIFNSTLISTTFSYPKVQEFANLFIAKNIIMKNLFHLNETQKRRLGSDLNDLVLICVYSETECKADDFVWYFDNVYGNCFQFNSGFDSNGNARRPIVLAEKSGLNNGLMLLLFNAMPDDLNSLAMFTGFHVFINNRTVAPSTMSGFDISPGFRTNIGLSKSTVERLPAPYSDCIRDDDERAATFSRNTKYSYTQNDCLSLAKQKHNIKRCKCADSSYASVDNVAYCATFEQTACLFNASAELFESRMGMRFLEQCPPECSISRFEFTTSMSHVLTRSFGRILMNNSYIRSRFSAANIEMSYESLRNSLAWVNVYLDDTRYTYVSESPIQSSLDLLSSIGGTLGLYIGISFLSMAELVELAINLVLLTCEHRSRAKAVGVDDESTTTPDNDDKSSNASNERSSSAASSSSILDPESIIADH